MNLQQQFAKPAGFLGGIAGHFMAMRNRERSEWVLSMLDLKPADRVLEIGFGPGADISRASRQAAFVAGIDHSETMVKQASGRNAAAIREGRVQLQLGSADRLHFPDENFDRVFAINSAQFWKDLNGALTEIRRVLKPGGWVGLAIQPRNKGATDDHAYHAGRGFSNAMNNAGFQEVHAESRQMKPVSTVCVLGRK